MIGVGDLFRKHRDSYDVRTREVAISSHSQTSGKC